MTRTTLNRRRFALLAAAGAAAVAAPSLRAQGKPEKSKVSIAVGGKAAFYY
ncbi:MAG TPA: ABC transporter substrate-binding protein, partial [Ramlibacter sp.]